VTFSNCISRVHRNILEALPALVGDREMAGQRCRGNVALAAKKRCDGGFEFGIRIGRKRAQTGNAPVDQ
jgi:hypothetical protein